MPTDVELDRIAGALHVLRPEWATESLRAYLNEHRTLAYADLLSAAVAIAGDPSSATIRRLSESGPWWMTVRQDSAPRVGPGDEPACEQPGHEHELARACRCCRSEAIARADSLEPAER